MKKAKIKNNKKRDIVIDEPYSFKKFAITVLVLSIFLVIFLVISSLLIKPQENEIPLDPNTRINTKDMTLNNLFEQEEDEYYVLATKVSKNNRADFKKLYDSYLNDYSKKENSLKVYKINLSNAINRSYLGDSLNISNDLKELKLTDDTLLKIKDKEIDSYYVGSKDILNELSNLKES